MPPIPERKGMGSRNDDEFFPVGEVIIEIPSEIEIPGLKSDAGAHK